MNRIRAIELEGFQSINRRTRIDFADITLLYGTNSAGKSALSDAFEFLEAFSNFKNYSSERVFRLLDRWASWLTTDANKWQTERDRENGYKNPDLYRTVKVSVEYDLEIIDPSDFDLDERLASPIHQTNARLCFGGEDFVHELEQTQPLIARVEVEFSVRGTGCYEEGYYNLLSLVFILNNKKIAYLSGSPPFDDGEEKSLRIWEHFAYVYPGPFWSVGIGAEAQLYLSGKTSGAKAPNEKEFRAGNDDPESAYWTQYNTSWNNFYQVDFSSDFYPADKVRSCVRENFRDISFYFMGCLHSLLKNSPSVVTADRAIPDSHKFFSVIDFGYSEGWWPDNELSPTGPLLTIRDQSTKLSAQWISVAKAGYASILKNALDHDQWGSDWGKEQIKERVSRFKLDDYIEWAERFNKINGYLGNELFDNRLYQVQSNVILLVPLDLNEEDPRDPYYLLSQPAAVTLHLIDARGKRVEFRDVGSGIPFVVPILIALTQPGAKFLQQPELHLHPKLQGKLADVFIDAAGQQSGPLIIETHSEHILLRLLRRIRQTTKGMTSAYRLTNEQISVYYFDGEVSGGTLITKQLVTPLGDFYNDWPKGFFNERDEDLFDD